MNIIIKIFGVLILLYTVICVFLYHIQENLIFFPEKLPHNYVFSFNNNFQEIYIKASDNKLLHGILFKAKESKGLIFYLHGNAGCLSSWGYVANTYTQLNYDIFILDYPAYGKSGGAITSQEKFFKDVDIAYNEIRKRYDEKSIIVLGYSIGTGPASYIASIHEPKLLILQAPYVSLTDIMVNLFPVIPTFVLKYKFETYKYVKACKMPIVVFHGTEDEVINFKSSLKLQKYLKKTDKIIPLVGEGHNGITDNSIYIKEMRDILR